MSDQRAGLFHKQPAQWAEHGGPHRGYLSHYLVFGYTRSFPFKHPRVSRSQIDRRPRARADRTQKIWPADMTKGHKTKEMKTKTIRGREKKVEARGNHGKGKIRGDFIKNKTPAAVLLKLRGQETDDDTVSFSNFCLNLRQYCNVCICIYDVCLCSSPLSVLPPLPPSPSQPSVIELIKMNWGLNVRKSS